MVDMAWNVTQDLDSIPVTQSLF